MIRKLFIFFLILVPTSKSFSQSPGGVTGSLQVWLKANAGTFSNAGTTAATDGGTMQQWNDQGGSGNNATQTTAAAKPIWQNSAATGMLNFNPRVSLDGSAQYLTLPSGFSTFTAGLSFFGVNSLTNTGIQSRFFELGNGAPSNNVIVYRKGTTAQAGFTMYNGTAPFDAFTATNVLNLNIQCLYQALLPAGTALSSVAASFKTNALSAGFSPNIIVPNIVTRTLNYIGKSNWAVDALQQGQIGEFILFNRTLTATEEQKVQSYLALKYGVTLDQTSARDYLASDGTTKMWSAATAGTFNQNIFGIGLDNTSALNQKVSASVNARGIATVATDNDFSSANSTGTRTSLSTNLQFLTISDNSPASGNPTWTAVASPTGMNILNSQWMVQNVGSVGGIYLQFNVANTNYDVPVLTSGTSYYLIYDNSGTISASSTKVILTNTSGNLWSTSSPITFSNGAKFTLATSIAAPGGVSNGLFWFRADDGVSSNTTWQDAFHNAWDVTGTATFNTSSNLVNYNPDYLFNGTSNFFSTTSNSYTNVAANGEEVFGMVNTVSASAYRDVIGLGTVASNLYSDEYRYFNTGNLWDAGETPPSWIDARSNSAITMGQWLIQGANKITGTNYDLRTNGASIPITNGTANFGGTAFNQLNIGARRWNGANDQFYNGQMAEVIMYGRKLSATERSKVESYLALKYGITLDQTTAQNYLASDGSTIMWTAAGAFNKNIFGIGRDDNSALHQKVSASVNPRGIVTIATTNDFTSANSNGARTALSNMQFLTVSDNSPASGNPTWTGTAAPSGMNILSSQWLVQNVGSTGSIYLQFDVGNTNYDVPAPMLGTTYYLIYANSGTISAASTVVALINTGGNLWSTSSPVSLSYGAKFTLATSISSPGGVIGTTVWYKADAGTSTVTNGSSLAQWNDQSGGNINLSQVTGSLQPTYRNNTTDNINFNPTVKFSGSQYIYNGGSGIGLSDASSTLFAATKPAAVSTVQDVLSYGNGAAMGIDLRLNNTALQYYQIESGVSASVSSGALAVAGVPAIVGSSMASIASNNATLYYNNSVANTTGTINSSSSGAFEISVGASIYNTIASIYNGDIPEVIAYSATLTATQRQQVNSYLALKWGITLNQSSPQNYINSAGTTYWNASTAASGFNNDIFGIGRDDNSALLQKVSTSSNGDGLFIMALDSDYTSANNAAGRTTAFAANNYFVTMANNNGAYTFSQAGLGVYAGHSRTGRTWQMQSLGSQDSVYIAFRYDSLSTAPHNSNLYLLRSTTNDFVHRANFTYTKLSFNGATGYYSLKIPVVNLQYITVAAVSKEASMRHRKLFLFGDYKGYLPY